MKLLEKQADEIESTGVWSTAVAARQDDKQIAKIQNYAVRAQQQIAWAKAALSPACIEQINKIINDNH